MKIGFFTDNLEKYIGGGRLYSWHIAHCLAAKGHEVLIFTNANPVFDREFVNFPGRDRIKIFCDNYYHMRTKEAPSLLKSCDVLLCTPLYSVDLCVTFAEMHNKKVIAFCFEPNNVFMEAVDSNFGVPFTEWHGKRFEDFTKQIHKTNAIVCNNHFMAEKCREWLPVYKGKILSLYNGINTLLADKIKLVPKEERENSVVFCSRTQMYKGFGDIPYIFGQLKTNKPKIHYISGFIDRMDPVHIKFFELCKNEAKLDIEIHNRIDDRKKFEIMSKAKCLFFPSRFEGFGLPPAEAFFFKTPVVCYDLPVLQEVYQEFPHYLPSFEPGEGVTLFEELLSNNDLLFKDIDEAKLHVEKFVTLENFSNNLNEIVQGFVSNGLSTYKSKKYEKVVIEKKKKKRKKKVIKQEEIKAYNEETEYVKLIPLDPDHTMIVSKGAEVLKDVEKQLLMVAHSGYDFVFGNPIIEGKESPKPEYFIEAFIKEPDYIKGVVVCKNSALGKMSIDFHQEHWNVQLCLNTREFRWKNIGIYTHKMNRTNYNAFELVSRFVSIFTENGMSNCFFVVPCEDNYRFKVIYAHPNKKVLIVIVSRNGKWLPDLAETLPSKNSGYDICLVQHKKEFDIRDKKFDKFRELISGHLIIEDKFNFCTMNNKAIDSFSDNHDYYILMNDDLLLNRDALKNLIKSFEYNLLGDVGIVGAKLLSPKKAMPESKFPDNWYDNDYKLQHAGIQLTKNYKASHMGLKLSCGRLGSNFMREVDAVTFALVAIDAELYDSIKLDPELPNDFNDVDFCLKAKKKGFVTLYNPDAVAFHLSAATRTETIKGSSKIEGAELFYNRYKEQINKAITYRELKQLEFCGY